MNVPAGHNAARKMTFVKTSGRSGNGLDGGGTNLTIFISQNVRQLDGRYEDCQGQAAPSTTRREGCVSRLDNNFVT